MLKAVLVSSVFFNIGLLAGRLSGFARESFLAASFGVGPESDVAVLMLSLPDLLVNILVGGGIAASLIPEFNRSPYHARTLLFQSLVVFSGVFIVFSFFTNWHMPWVLGVFAPGFNDFQEAIAHIPMQLVMWLVPLTVATGVVASYLNAHNRFLASSMGTLVINAVIIAGLLFIYYLGGDLEILALFILLGGLVRFIMQFVAAARVAGLPKLTFVPWVVNRALTIRFLQVAGAGSVLLSYPVVIRAYASYGQAGDVALVSFATKLVELPLAITVTFLSVILFPRMSNAYEKNHEQFLTLCVWGIRMTLFLSLLAVASIYPISNALADLVFGYGKMSTQSVIVIAELTAIGLFFIPFLGISTFIAASFNAKHDTITPLVINVIMLAVLFVVLETLQQPSLDKLVGALVVAYMGVGCLSFLVFSFKQKGLLRQVIDVFYLPLILVACTTVYFVLTWLLPLISHEASAVWSILLAMVVAAFAAIVSGCFVPPVRAVLLTKLIKS